MNAINAQELICNIVIKNPRRAEVFDKHRIDYCCAGKRPLAEICIKKGIDIEDLVLALQEVDNREGEVKTFDLENSSINELTDHIESTHHRYLENEVPAIAKLLKKVVARHGAQHSEFIELKEQFEAFSNEILEHIKKEENILFLRVRSLDNEIEGKEFSSKDLKNYIVELEHEHDATGEFLEKFRSLTGNYKPFDGACSTVRVLLQKLHDLEEDMHRHVHKENHVLFPNVLAKIAS